MTIYTFVQPNGTDVSAVPGWSRPTGNSGSMTANADGRVDIVTSSPISVYYADSGYISHEMEVNLYIVGGGNNYYIIAAEAGGFPALGFRISPTNNVEASYIVNSTTIIPLAGAGGLAGLTGPYPTGTRAIGDKIKGVVDRTAKTLTVQFNGVTKFVVPDLDVNAPLADTGTYCGVLVRSTTGVDLFNQIEIVGVASEYISEVNEGSNTVEYGEVFTWETTGLTPDSATISGLPCLSVSATGGTIPSLVDETVVPTPGIRPLIASDSVGNVSTPEFPVTLNLPAGLRSVELAGTLNTSATGVIHNFSPAAKAGDFIAWPTEVDEGDIPLAENYQTIISPEADIDQAFFIGSRTFWHISTDESDPDVGTAYSYTVTLVEGGSVSVTRSLSIGIGVGVGI